MIKILNLWPEGLFDGCFKYRNYTPFKELKKRGYEVCLSLPIKRFDFNIVILNKAVGREENKIIQLLTEMKQRGAKIIYDTDDLTFFLPKSNFFSSSEQTQKAIKILKSATFLFDLITVSSPILKEELERIVLNKISVLPNFLYPPEWKKRAGQNKILKIGYAGSTAHLEDLLLITDVIFALQKKYDFWFHILGISAISLEKDLTNLKQKLGFFKPKWARIALRLLKKLKKLKYFHHPFVKTQNYPEELCRLNFDIGLCPLIDNRFNRCKTAIKFYEYAIVGTTTLASNVKPYNLEEKIILTDNNFKSWKNSLEELITDKNLRESMAEAQRNYVLETKDIRKNIYLWEETYLNLLN